MKSFRMSWIVHGFALLHFAMAYFGALAAIPDSRLLTLMTLLMTLVICVRENANLETTCLSFVILTIAGYYLGMESLKLCSYLTGELLSPLNQAVSSFITTEFLGWGLYALLHFAGNSFKTEESDEHYWDKRFSWVALAVLLVFGVRLLIGMVVSPDLFPGDSMYGYFYRFLQNYALLLLLLAGTIAVMRHLLLPRLHGWGRLAAGATFFLLATACGALAQAAGLPFHYTGGFSREELLREALVAGSVELLLMGLTYLILTVLRDRRLAGQERKETRRAIFRYQNLKQQVNPHFLFNSLNTLDGLVLEQRTGEASDYIHKLSGIYRYMLQNENARLVPLRQEMEYVQEYAGLLQVRFPEGLQVSLELREEDLERQVVPCAVQLLLENAVQHNITASSRPLKVRIYSDGEVVGVENNLQPKKRRADSHGVGQRYIRQQYADVAGTEIRIDSTEELYRVELPLL